MRLDLDPSFSKKTKFDEYDNLLNVTFPDSRFIFTFRD